MRINIKAVYDTCRKLADDIKEKSKDGAPVDKSLLDTLSRSFSDIIEFEKTYLIQCQDKFYGNILMSLDIDIDYKQRGATDLKITNGTDFQLTINPLFCADKKFSEFTGLIAEEITRLVWNHPSVYAEINHEGDSKKHELLNEASDAAASTIIKHDLVLKLDDSRNNGCRLPEDAYTKTNVDLDCGIRSKSDMPINYYYNVLDKFKKDKGSSKQFSSYQSENGTNASKDGKDSSKDNKDSTGKESVASPTNDNGNSTHQWEQKDKNDIEDAIKDIVSVAYNNLDDKQRGYIPGSVASQIQQLLAPPQISWKQILRKMIGSIPVPYRSTKRRLNRLQPFRTDLAGRLPKRTVNIVCAFDTSGSVSDNELMYCVNEVFNIIKSYEGYKVTIIECDAEIDRIYEAKKPADVKLKMFGRGGTSYIPVINYLNGTGEFKNNPKYPKAGNYKDALLIYFTDGYGDYDIPKPNTYKNMWVVFNDEKNLSVKNPYGIVKTINTDDDFKAFKNK